MFCFLVDKGYATVTKQRIRRLKKIRSGKKPAGPKPGLKYIGEREAFELGKWMRSLEGGLNFICFMDEEDNVFMYVHKKGRGM